MRHFLASRPAELPALLDHWVATGVITPEQAARMRADLGAMRPRTLTVLPTPTPTSTPAPAPVVAPAERRQASIAIEALGYLGSLMIVIASVLLASQYWDDLSAAGHLVVVGAAAVLLLGAGFAVPARLGEAAVRMHAALWIGATLSTAGFLGILGDEVLGWYDADLALLVFAGTTALAAVLWWQLPTVVQQAPVVVGLAGVAGAAAAQLEVDHLPGIAVWGVGAIWFLLGWGRVVRPRWAALLFGGIAVIVGPGMTMPADGGIVLALATITALLCLAVLARDLLILAVGAWGALQFLPIAINEWFPGELAAAVVLLVVGGLLVVGAVWIARRRTGGSATAQRRAYTVPAGAALISSACVAAGVTAVILAWGLT
ncbi:DUF2157 domain-containing protein [Kribbella shirazensis]|uniref:DUF2157 domain-containing protein n=1 Tax=Kribbella shirazensis TaxID=1105143 RepID=A0A7X5VDC4_9ACTN|nr:DUF2157 domain-containing protein [Kribbella shirazensis]NIK59156.1 hypothetical protein [Kribbella shirazensis]